MIRLERTLVYATLLLLFGVAASQVHSFDIFWQLQSGKYILETKKFIYQDIFSLAADVPRFEHCWLHDVLFYLVYKVGGYQGISLLKGVLILSAGGLAVLVARLRHSPWLAILFLFPPALFLTRGGWLERPQLWSFFFFLLFLLLLEKYRSNPGAFIWWLLPAMALWANFHAGSVLAFPVLTAYLAGEGLNAWLGHTSFSRRDYFRLFGILPSLAVASLATPYGLQVLKTLFGAPRHGTISGQLTQIYNMDWRATTWDSAPAFYIAIGLTVLLLVIHSRKIDCTDLFLFGGIALMGFQLERHTTFFLLLTAAFLPKYLASGLQPLLSPIPKKYLFPMRVSAIALAIMLVHYSAKPAYSTSGLFNLGIREWHYPVRAAEFIKEQKLPANLYNAYEWGGYLMWTLYPDYLVFWDGRSDSNEMFRLGFQVITGEPGWEQILERFGINLIAMKTCTMDTGQLYPLVDRLRSHPDWPLVFADRSTLIFVRRGAMAEGWLNRHQLPEERIDDTILSEASLLTQHAPQRYLAWWEMARIQMERKHYPQAFAALENHLRYAPQGRHEPVAERYYRFLYPMFSKPKETN